uniref:protein CUSTOS isoform X2 n=1 Tax=Jaculus jaculus TaxID=51337 RepID=UPI0003330FFB|nr:protein CUSTOS isoform X2 [Jaculus jaculus]
MVAPRGTMSDSESSNGSSSEGDEEELARCREAARPAWDFEPPSRPAEKPKADATSNQLPTSQPSLRRKVDQHDHDGNELQTTPEFRAHVAKKLGALLDSSITISEAVKEPRKAEAQKAASEDDGFRLFFTSVPGDPKEEASPQTRQKRRPPSSSEDSEEEWQRCREAAVSASDILQESAIHSPGMVEKETKEKKKKLKKKAKKVATTDLAIAATPASEATAPRQEKETGKVNGDRVSLGTKKKKRKKKIKQASEASQCPQTE